MECLVEALKKEERKNEQSQKQMSQLASEVKMYKPFLRFWFLQAIHKTPFISIHVLLPFLLLQLSRVGYCTTSNSSTGTLKIPGSNPARGMKIFLCVCVCSSSTDFSRYGSSISLVVCKMLLCFACVQQAILYWFPEIPKLIVRVIDPLTER